MKEALYRLVSLDGNPHPVLDTPYESIEAAIIAANNLVSSNYKSCSNLPCIREHVGIEVKTSNGSWRTISYS